MCESQRNAIDNELAKEMNRLRNLVQKSGMMTVSDVEKLEEKIDSANDEIHAELLRIREDIGIELGKQAIENKKRLDRLQALSENNEKQLNSVEEQIDDLESIVNAHITEIASKLKTDREQAVFYYESLAAIIARIERLYPEKYEVLYQEQLQPGFYALRTALSDAGENIEKGYYETAISVAQIRIPEAFNVVNQLEVFHGEFLSTDEVTRQRLETAEKWIKEADQVKQTKIVVDGTEYDDNYNLSYWARELYEEITNKMKQVKSNYLVCADALDTKGLLLVQKDIEGINSIMSVAEIVENNERTMHYECCEHAAKIYDALYENDNYRWAIKENRINENDLREPICMILNNKAGNEIVVTCFPTRGDDLTSSWAINCQIEVFDKDRQKDDLTKCNIIYNDVVAVLSGYGLLPCSNKAGVTGGESKSFIESTIQKEISCRNNWIEEAKRSVGLTEEE